MFRLRIAGKDYAGTMGLTCDWVQLPISNVRTGFDEVVPLLLDALRANQRRSLKCLFGVPLNDVSPCVLLMQNRSCLSTLT